MLLTPSLHLRSLACTRFFHVSRRALNAIALQNIYDNAPVEERTNHARVHGVVLRTIHNVSRTFKISRPGHERIEANLSPAETFRWRQVVTSRSFSDAMVVMDQEVVPTLEGEHHDSPLPPVWLLVYLLSNKVFSTNQAMSALFYTLENLSHFEPEAQPSILVLLVRCLARHQVVAHIHSPVEAFLHLDIANEYMHFNLLLRALSKCRQCVDVAKVIIRVLHTMESRRLKLRSDTYSALLQNRVLTVQLTKILQDKMARDGFVPKASHLEAFLRIFGKSGAVHSSARYLTAIRTMHQRKGYAGPLQVDVDADDEPTISIDNHGDRLPSKWTRHNTMHLRSMVRNRPAAFQYLQDLVQADTHNNEVLKQIPRPRHSRIGNKMQHDPRSLASHSRVHDWTTALFIAGRDRTLSADDVLSIFHQSQKFGFAPSQATYTTVMKSLLSRGNFDGAYKLWGELVKKKYVDRQALTIGIKAMAATGNLLEAFNALEYYLLKPGDDHDPSGRRPGQRLRGDVLIINSFMSALISAGRPDLVFKMWDNMGILYGIRPDETSISLLILAARIAMKYDASIRGILKHVNQLNPFRHREVDAEDEWRSHVVSSFRETLDTEKNGAPTITGFWGDHPAGPRTRDLFRRILFLNKPALRGTESPTVPVLSEAAQKVVNRFVSKFLHPESEMQDGKDHKTIGFYDPSSIRTQRNVPILAPYSHISLNDVAFRSYIKLLASLGKSSEVPLVLGWMKDLRIKPTKETLTVAIILWAEVGMKGPIQESYMGQRSQYNLFLQWLKEWLGEQALPSDSRIAQGLRALAKERDPENKKLRY